MQIKLFNYNGENHRIDKRSFLENEVILNGVLKEETDLINPTILIDVNQANISNELDVVTEDNKDIANNSNQDISVILGDKGFKDILSKNYVYIESFSRYYFVNNVRLFRASLWYFELKVDVLMSFKDQFLNLNAYIERNEKDYNKYLVDNKVQFREDTSIRENDIKNVSGANLTTIGNTSSVVINWITDKPVKDGDTYSTGAYDSAGGVISSKDGILPSIDPGQTESQFYSHTYTAILNTPSALSAFANYIYDDNNYSQYVVSIYSFPLDFDKNHIAGESLGINKGGILKNSFYDDSWYYPCGDSLSVGTFENVTRFSKRYLIADFNFNDNFWINDNFLDYKPYNEIYLYLPYFNYVELNFEDCYQSEIKVYYTFNYLNGQGMVQIVNATKNRLIYTSTTQIGERLNVVSTDKLSRDLTTAIDGVSAVFGSAFSPTEKQASSAVKGGVEVGKDLITGIKTTTQLNQSGDGYFAHYNPMKVRTRQIRKMTSLSYIYNYDYLEIYGGVSQKMENLKTIHGYTEVGRINLKDLTGAKKEEVDELNNLLKTGVILP